MADYKKILVALDFSPTAEQVMARASQIRDRSGASLFLIHVVEYLPPMEPAGDMFIGVDWGVNEQDLLEVAQRQFEKAKIMEP